MMLRIGQGFDFHTWSAEPVDCIQLGGISVPYHRAIKAHSDGDVILHALCDAILGALGLGDIGEHFPDTNPAYQGASSKIFVIKIRGWVEEQAWQIENIDLTFIAQAPKLAPYRSLMCTYIAGLLAIRKDQINIKATTMESVGCVGREEGIAAMAVVLLIKKGRSQDGTLTLSSISNK